MNKVAHCGAKARQIGGEGHQQPCRVDALELFQRNFENRPEQAAPQTTKRLAV
jgi:hypothetical protein